MENIVVFKGGRDGIVVVLNDKVPFADIKNIFIQKLQDAKDFFSGAKVSMRFKGRILTKEQQEEILDILSGQNVVNISFVHDFESEEQEIEQESLEVMNSYDTSMTKYHVGILRSGQYIEYPGSIVIIGDVNPGAKILAGGSVIVLGTLKGTVHAGKDKNAYKPFVTAIGMYPSQVGIGDVIARSPDDMHSEKDKHKECALIAYLSDNQIYIEPIDQKAISNLMINK